MDSPGLKIALVFRSSYKGGKSIEGLFQPLLQEIESGVQFFNWEYDVQNSILSNILRLRRVPADIWHITGDISYLVLGLLGRKIVLTIHDIGRYKELSGWKKWVYGRLWIAWPIRFSHRVTVVSEYTRNDILKYFEIKNPDKIRVIHNAANPLYANHVKSVVSSPPRILQIGTAINKNLETLIIAVSSMNCMLCIVGPLSESQKDILTRLNVHYENFQDLSVEQLRHQYGLADIVVFVSLHEGFGMPIIEAQAMGRPVITSRVTSIPEVAGEGALFINNPMDAKELRTAIDRLIQDAALRSTLIDKGRKNAKRYTYDNMAKAYIKLYGEVGAE